MTSSQNISRIRDRLSKMLSKLPRNATYSNNFQAGFTLIELMVTVIIVAILSAMAAPSYRSIVTDMRLRSEINSLLNDLNFARSEALKRGQSITVCPSLSPTSTTIACDATANWSTGWVVLAPLAAAPLLRLSAGVTRNDTLTNSSTNIISITPLGYAFTADTIRLRDSANSVGLYRCIVFASGSWTLQIKGAPVCQ